jgi:hypothetical protein
LNNAELIDRVTGAVGMQKQDRGRARRLCRHNHHRAQLDAEERTQLQGRGHEGSGEVGEAIDGQDVDVNTDVGTTTSKSPRQR